MQLSYCELIIGYSVKKYEKNLLTSNRYWNNPS